MPGAEASALHCDVVLLDLACFFERQLLSPIDVGMLYIL